MKERKIFLLISHAIRDEGEMEEMLPIGLERGKGIERTESIEEKESKRERKEKEKMGRRKKTEEKERNGNRVI